MVNVTNGADVAVRLVTLEFFLRHFSVLPSVLNLSFCGENRRAR
jgi:hypothetical protein